MKNSAVWDYSDYSAAPSELPASLLLKSLGPRACEDKTSPRKRVICMQQNSAELKHDVICGC